MQPHLKRYWLTKKRDERSEEKTQDICETYALALKRLAEGEVTFSVDEMTGIQALERSAPGLPMTPGNPERREFEYVRHGTQTLTAAFDVATGHVFGHVGETRTEDDFAAYLRKLMEQKPDAERYHIVVDNLNTHMSEAVVRFVANMSGIEEGALGVKGKTGVLENMRTREDFLHDPKHKVVFHFTPKHASWLNQIEIWFSILVKKVIRRGNFASKEDLRDKILSFIDYFNTTLAKPFRWTYQGKPLAI